jgi:hypothetical protein
MLWRKEMIEETPNEPTGWLAGRFSHSLNLRLAGAACGLLLALLIASGTRRLFLAQAGLTLPVPSAVASVAGGQLGIHPDPFYSRIAFQAAHAVAARHPNDLQMQIADAGTFLPEGSISPSVLKVQRLRALESRFGECASLYANILRYETMGEVRVHHDREQYVFSGDPIPNSVKKSISARDAQNNAPDVCRAYDRDAATGERLDPANAYFPFMRAVGLFGAHKDAEALAAIARAAQKPQWREYYNDELKGQWKLQDEASMNNSALFHSLLSASILFPHYAQMRAAVRVTIYAAMQAEQAGHIAEGLAIRKNVVRLGSLMRIQSPSLIGSLVGNALTEIAICRPAGLPAIKGNERNEKTGKEQQRRQFDAYLQRVGAASATDFFHSTQQAGDEMKEIVRHGLGTGPFDQPLKTLFIWWVVDLATLSNILWLLVLGGLASVFLRDPRLQAGMALSGHMRFALPLGVLGGAFVAPTLLTGLSLYFLNIASEDRFWMLLMGLAPILLLLALPATLAQDRIRRLYAFGCALAVGAGLTGFYFWQAHGIAGIAGLMQVYFNLSSESGPSGPDMHNAALWLTPCVSFLLLIVMAALSLACRVPLSVGLARGFRGLMVPVTALLFLAYGGMLLFTVRAEAAVQYGLERTLENEGQYMADLSGKLWPCSDVAKKLVAPESTTTGTNPGGL